MDVGSITGMTVIVALLGVLVVGLLSYMSSLVRRAYELKVELHNEIDRGLKRIEEDLDVKNRRLKREAQDDIAKSKDAIRQENDRRQEETVALLDGTLDAFREQIQAAHGDQNRAIEDLRARHATLKREIAQINQALHKHGVATASSPADGAAADRAE
jgi:small-conductance mechanosensitive channel